MPAKLPSKQRSTLSSLSLKTLGAAMMSVMLISNTAAAGLGKLTVLSALGQPLNAEIELNSTTREEAATLVPKLAPPEAFRQANIEMHPSLLGLRFAIEQRGTRQVIRVTSAQAMNEPFVDMLLEVGVPNGRLVREYTFLLDPPDVRARQSPQLAATPRVAPAPTEARLSIQPIPALAALAKAAPATENTAAASDVKEREVRRGETLSQIARENKPDGISLDQMLVALYRSNPGAFIGKNMNRLRAGTILALPDAADASGTSNAEAHRIVLAQSANFNEYRNQLAGQVANADAKSTAETKNTASGKITAKVAEAATPADEAADKLKLSKSMAGGAAASPVNSAEDKIARDKALEESSARVKELERIVSDLQKVAEMKSKDLAERQKLAEAEKGMPIAEATTAPVPVPVPVPEASAPAPAVAAAASKPAAVAAVAATQPTMTLATLLDNPLVLPGAGILLALLGSLGFMAARRKREAQHIDEQDFNEPSLESNSIFDAPGGQRVDTTNSVFNTGFVPTGDQSVTNEVDPVAEADVYIAYGRDVQAEEILKEALRINPARHPVRIKLLEIYANRKDAATFALLAGELHGMIGDSDGQWLQIATLGLGIDPANSLYAPKNKQAVDESLPVSQLADVTEELVPTPTAMFPDTAKALDFYAGDTDKATSDEVPAAVLVEPAVATKSILANNIEEINFDFLDAGQEKPAPTASKSGAAMSTAELESEFALIEASLSLNGNAASGPAPVPIDFDLSDITLDLNPQESAAATPDPEATVLGPREGLEEFDIRLPDEDSSEISSEMVTKLDLAAAYEEIGDKEGARELIDEVIKGGSDEQIAKANTMRALLS